MGDGIAGHRALGHQHIGKSQPLLAEHVAQFPFGFVMANFAAAQRRRDGPFMAQATAAGDHVIRAAAQRAEMSAEPTREPGILAHCGKDAQRGGMDQPRLAPVGLGTVKQRGANPLNQQQRQCDREQHLPLQASGPQPRKLGSFHHPVTRRTSAARM